MSWWLRLETVRWSSRRSRGGMMEAYWGCFCVCVGMDFSFVLVVVVVVVGGMGVEMGLGPAGAEADVVECAIACTHRRQTFLTIELSRVKVGR